jgi:hypothetical protein
MCHDREVDEDSLERVERHRIEAHGSNDDGAMRGDERARRTETKMRTPRAFA